MLKEHLVSMPPYAMWPNPGVLIPAHTQMTPNVDLWHRSPPSVAGIYVQLPDDSAGISKNLKHHIDPKPAPAPDSPSQ